MTPAAGHKSNHIEVAVAVAVTAVTVPLPVAVALERIRHMQTSAPPTMTRGSCNCCLASRLGAAVAVQLSRGKRLSVTCSYFS